MKLRSWLALGILLLFTVSCGNSKTGNPPAVPGPTAPPGPTTQPTQPHVTTWDGYLKGLKSDEGDKPLLTDSEVTTLTAHYKKLNLDVTKFAMLNDYLATVKVKDEETSQTKRLFSGKALLNETEQLMVGGSDPAAFIMVHRTLETDLSPLNPAPHNKALAQDVVDSAQVVSKKDKDAVQVDKLFKQFMAGAQGDPKISSADAVREIGEVYRQKAAPSDFESIFAYLVSLKSPHGGQEYSSETAANYALAIVRAGVSFDKFKAAYEYFSALKRRDGSALTSFPMDLTLTMVKAKGFDLAKFKADYESLLKQKAADGDWIYVDEAEAFTQSAENDLGLDVALQGLFD